MLLLAEGIASCLVVGREMFSHAVPIVGQYTKFDSELGWVSIPNAYVTDLFGPGTYFRSNSQGFRNNEEFSKEIPAGRFRVICSGDSFTLGYGVSNDEAWCQVLTQLDTRIQSVNMGQTAYGIDQAYLWYERDGSKLDLDMHIFAFISDDLARMTFASHWGYGKPMLTMANGKLAVTNVPVPHYSAVAAALAERLPKLNDLRSLQVLRRLFGGKAASAAAQDYWERQSRAVPLAFQVFDTLQKQHKEKNALFALVYMPSVSDCLGEPGDDEKLLQMVEAESRKRGLWFWNLAGECQQLPGKRAEGMFFSPAQLAHYHLTPEGNRLTAEMVYRRMKETPEIAARLERTPENEKPNEKH